MNQIEDRLRSWKILLLMEFLRFGTHDFDEGVYHHPYDAIQYVKDAAD